MKRNYSCYDCGYYKNGYCNDLDTRVDPYDPVCSEENYNS